MQTRGRAKRERKQQKLDDEEIKVKNGAAGPGRVRWRRKSDGLVDVHFILSSMPAAFHRSKDNFSVEETWNADDLTLKELQYHLKRRNIDHKGKKADLIIRLNQALSKERMSKYTTQSPQTKKNLKPIHFSKYFDETENEILSQNKNTQSIHSRRKYPLKCLLNIGTDTTNNNAQPLCNDNEQPKPKRFAKRRISLINNISNGSEDGQNPPKKRKLVDNKSTSNEEQNETQMDVDDERFKVTDQGWCEGTAPLRPKKRIARRLNQFRTPSLVRMNKPTVPEITDNKMEIEEVAKKDEAKSELDVQENKTEEKEDKREEGSLAKTEIPKVDPSLQQRDVSLCESKPISEPSILPKRRIAKRGTLTTPKANGC